MQFALPVFLLLPDDDCHGPSKVFYDSAAEYLKNTSIKAYFFCAALKSAEAHPAMGVTCPNLDERERLCPGTTIRTRFIKREGRQYLSFLLISS